MDASRYSAEETLRQGTRLLIRAAGPEDRDLLREALSRMSDRSIRQRFFTPRPRFSPEQIEFFTHPDFERQVALVAVEPGDAERIVGGARYVADEKGAEVAFAVVDDRQGLGIGSLLLHHLALIARAKGVTAWSAEVLEDNKAMLRVFERAGLLTTSCTSDGESLHLDMQLDPPAANQPE